MTHDEQPWCDGTDADTAYTEHPRVYFAWDDNGKAQCPYCGRLFVKEKAQ